MRKIEVLRLMEKTVTVKAEAFSEVCLCRLL